MKQLKYWLLTFVSVFALGMQAEGVKVSVDLGLPSGTLWATCNVGASSPEETGSYFAWGETTTKDQFTQANYTYNDTPSVLPSAADAAYVNWGSAWTMPTKEQAEELLNYCTVSSEDGGRRFTGPNGKSILMPAAGFKFDNSFDQSQFIYQTKTNDTGSNKYYNLERGLKDPSGWSVSVNAAQYYGVAIRPVAATAATRVHVTGVSLSLTTTSVEAGESLTLTPSFTPSNATLPYVKWTSSNTSVATVDAEGKVTTLAAGTATITATAIDGGKKATCAVTVTPAREKVDLGLPSGTLWATCNIGAASSEEAGDYFAWGETTAKSSFTQANYTYSGTPDVLPSAADAAYVNWGSAWTMPTKEQAEELLNYCTVSGEDGGTRFTGPNGKSILLPRAGFKFDGNFEQSLYAYQTKTNDTDSHKYYNLERGLKNPSGWSVSTNAQWYGVPIRPVAVTAATRVHVTGVSLSLTTTSVEAGQSLTLTPSFTPSKPSLPYVKWTSSNTSVATVDAEGQVTTLAPGTATITATTIDGGFTAQCEVTVNAPAPKDYTLSNEGATIQITPGASLADVVAALGAAASDITELYITGDYPTKASVDALKTTYFPNLQRVHLTLQTTATNIARAAYRNCTLLCEINIPNTITIIEDYAISNCTGITNVNIPSSVTDIGLAAFIGSTGITNVNIPSSVTSIGNYAFQECTKIASLTWGSSNCSPSAITQYCKGNLKEVTLLDGLTSIGENAFAGCTGLTSFTIPESVTSIASNAFSGCTNIASLTWGSSKCSPSAITQYCKGKLKEVTLMDGLTSIGTSAFSGCTGITNIDIPSSVTSIGTSTFYYCM